MSVPSYHSLITFESLCTSTAAATTHLRCMFSLRTRRSNPKVSIFSPFFPIRKAALLTSHFSLLNNTVFDNTQSGSAIANETLLHCTGTISLSRGKNEIWFAHFAIVFASAEGLPFGGIGPSGCAYPRVYFLLLPACI